MASSEACAKQSVEFKGSLFALPIIQLLTNDLTELSAQVENKVKQSPRFFQNAPVIIDLSHITQINTADLQRLVTLLKQHQMFPIGVQCSDPNLQQTALAANLAIMPNTKSADSTNNTPAPKPTVTEPNEKQTEEATSPTQASTKVITQPVRSGQQIYAPEGDLLILNSVSPGAELLAAGNIHVYGSLRGRALAGVHGNTEAHIFCQQLDAELVAIAGHYQASEELIADANEGKMVHIHLDDDQLRIDTI